LFISSVPGGCSIEIQTFPSEYTKERIIIKNKLLFGCHIFVTNFISGGLFG
jgi:hypothetical protein